MEKKVEFSAQQCKCPACGNIHWKKKPAPETNSEQLEDMGDKACEEDG